MIACVYAAAAFCRGVIRDGATCHSKVAFKDANTAAFCRGVICDGAALHREGAALRRSRPTVIDANTGAVSIRRVFADNAALHDEYSVRVDNYTASPASVGYTRT